MVRTPAVKLVIALFAATLPLTPFLGPRQLSAQEKKSATEGTRPVSGGPAAKQSTPLAEGTRATQTTDQEKPIPGDRKGQEQSARAADQANDYWTTPYGGFHMFGNSGHAVYRYPASPTGPGYDTTWTYHDSAPVGTHQGWTYKESGYNFYMFFGRLAESGKFWVGYSTDNIQVYFYAWAD
jgi:hypothetical protein